MVGINREVVHVLARNFVESYLSQQFTGNLAEKYLQIFDAYCKDIGYTERGSEGKKISVWSVKILGICNQIIEELHIRHRFHILLSLIRFSKYFEDFSTTTSGYTNTITDAVETVAQGLLITEEEYANCTAFIIDKFYNVPNRESLLIISDDRDFMQTEIRHMQKNQLMGQLFVLKIQRADTYLIRYRGKGRLEINGKYIFPRHVYLLPRGGSIKGEGIPPIYYSDIVSGYIDFKEGDELDFLARDIEFHFKNSPNGIQKFSFQGKSGQLIGVLGGSGAGKSTLLKVLNGSLKLDGGNIYINGHDLAKDPEKLEGMIGYIPQDDLLVEELTVYQNLYFNARLCLDGYDIEEIHETVKSVLTDLDLFDVRDLKVGTPLSKFISGGQRKRLNIALELVRGPHILFVDEPTSGLSSTDSENVLQLLKEQALSGKLVMANIHQPSSGLFKLFDHLLVLDRGGYPIYSGNPIEGINYFKQLAERVDASESECITCGNINPEEILQVIEARDVDEYGEFTAKRKISPPEWYDHYREKIESFMEFGTEKTWIPYNRFIVPGGLRQFAIFFKRNLLSKLADKQFMSIALIVSPVLATILGFFSKYVAGDSEDAHTYIFSQNENLPAYLFMSVIVALFLGLIISAEEIIKDRRILERESFLNLSRTSYLLSKVALLFILSGIQMFLFVIIGNFIMEIKGMTLSYWLVLFATSCFANLLGLIISDGLRSVVAIYVIVPFLLVPQILLAGVIVKFDKLHYSFASHESVPLSGDVMASRWAYEALVVNQFVNNRFQENFYRFEMLESNITYDMQFLIPTLIQEIQDASRLHNTDRDHPDLKIFLETIRSGFSSIILTGTFPVFEDLQGDKYDERVGNAAIRSLQDYQTSLSAHREKMTYQKDVLYDSLRSAVGGQGALVSFRRAYFNENLADMVLNRNELHKIVKIDGKLIRKMEPVYMYPVQRNGRAQFYASVKRIGNLNIPTLAFNIMVIWLMTIGLYFLLQYSILRKIIEFFGDLRRNR